MTLRFTYHLCWRSGSNQSVRLSTPVVSSLLWPGSSTFLDMASMVVTWWIVAFLPSGSIELATLLMEVFTVNSSELFLSVDWNVGVLWMTVMFCFILSIPSPRGTGMIEVHISRTTEIQLCFFLNKRLLWLVKCIKQYTAQTSHDGNHHASRF